MTALVLKLTDAGLAAVQGHAGSDQAIIAELGLTVTPFDYAPTLTSLPGEFKRIANVAGEAAAANITHLTAYDTSQESWSATGFGLFLGDGTLFAVHSSAEPVLSKASAAFALIALDIIFEADLAGNIQFGNAIFTPPPATTDMRGIVELATLDEAKAGADVLRALTPAAAKAAVLDWLGYTPANRAGDTFAGPFGRDEHFQFNLAGPNPFIGLDPDDWISFDRATDELWFAIAGRILMSLTKTSLNLAVPIKVEGHQVWHDGNDGAGSGSDADLLDGEQGSWYAAIADRLGYTPANRAGDTFEGPLTTAVHPRPVNVRIPADGSAGISWQLAGKAGFDIVVDSSGNMFFNRSDIATGEFLYTALSLLNDGTVSVGRALSRQGNTVWDAGNDGAGSGSDADLLDGQHGDFYTNIVARLGYTPLNVEAYNAADVLAKLRSVDGAGSDVDADLLDGQHGDFYTNIVARLGYTPLNVDTYNAADVLAKLRSVDGAGSDVDADLLDGQHGGFYTDIAGRLGYTPMNAASYNDFLRNVGRNMSENGYFRFSSPDGSPGLMLCWGRFSVGANTSASVAFPVAFPNACFSVQAGGSENLAIDAQDNAPAARTSTISAVGFSVFNARDAVETCSYFAVGF